MFVVVVDLHQQIVSNPYSHIQKNGWQKESDDVEMWNHVKSLWVITCHNPLWPLWGPCSSRRFADVDSPKCSPRRSDAKLRSPPLWPAASPSLHRNPWGIHDLWGFGQLEKNPTWFMGDSYHHWCQFYRMSSKQKKKWGAVCWSCLKSQCRIWDVSPKKNTKNTQVYGYKQLSK